MMSPLSSLVKRQAPCVAWAAVAVAGRDTRRPTRKE